MLIVEVGLPGVPVHVLNDDLPFVVPDIPSVVEIATPSVLEKPTPNTEASVFGPQKTPKSNPFPTTPLLAISSASCAFSLLAKYACQFPSDACTIRSFLPLSVTSGSPSASSSVLMF